MEASVTTGAEQVSLGDAVRLQPSRRSRDPSERLLAHALDALGALTSCAFAFAFTVDEHGTAEATIVRCRPGHDAEAVGTLLGRLRQLEPIDPFSPRRAEACRAAVMSAADAGGQARYLRSMHGEYLRRHGYGAPIVLYFRQRGRIVSGVSLVPDATSSPFDPPTLRFARELHPLLEHALTLSLVEAAAEGLDDVAPTAMLTAREEEVAGLVAGGARNDEIARRLGMRTATVKSHLTNIYSKLGVRSRTQLAVVLGRSAAAGDQLTTNRRS